MTGTGGGTIRLDDRVAVVTGAGGGLGRLYALHLAKRGAAVVVNDVQQDAADLVVEEIRSEGGRAVHDVNTVATPEGGQAIVATAMAEFGSIDAVVANAGIARRGAFDELSVDDMRMLLSVNLEGAIWVTQAAFPQMKAQGRGRIVLVTSAAAIYGAANGANYSASKAGVVGLLRSLTIEGIDHGVRTNAISPFAYTGMTVEAPGMTEKLARRLDPAWIAPVVVYLASDACELNGEILSVAGGAVARVVVSTTQGWRTPRGSELTPESVQEHLPEILDPVGAAMPTKVPEEVAHLLGSRARSGVKAEESR